ncbi:retrovirus-related pol polyprotein from transposon TNT 1-94 [Tanacetum coccineum]
MYKLDPVTLAPKDRNNRETHIYYLKYTMEQELLCYVRDTCPDIHKLSEKLVVVTPINKKKTVSYMFDARHELCFLAFVSDMNACSKSKSVNKAKKKEEWKPIGKVFTKIGYNWRPTGRTFTLVGNTCPLTRITATNKVPFREPTPLEVVAQEPVVTKVYTRRPKVPKTIGSNRKPKIAKSNDSKTKTEPGTSSGSQYTVLHLLLLLSISGCPNCFVVFGLPDCLKSYDYRSLSASNQFRFTIFFSSVLSVSVTTIFKEYGVWEFQIGNVHISKGYYVEGLVTQSIHRGKTISSALGYCVDHACCSSVNGKKYILIIVDNYFRFTWVKFIASKDEAPDFIIKFLKMIQVRLNAIVRNIRTDNKTEFVNQTLHSYYESVSISHETSLARSPQQNGVVERQNRTLVEAARTMLIYAKAPFISNLAERSRNHNNLPPKTDPL